MSNSFTESSVEEAVLERVNSLTFSDLHGPEFAPSAPAAEPVGICFAATVCSQFMVPESLRSEACRPLPRLFSGELST